MINRRKVTYHGTEILEESFRDVTWDELRISRNKELNNSDWRFMSDRTPSQEWVDYRQFLRDLPQQFTEANDAADAWIEYIIPE
tara:strand:+ start:392 stop:643 length:252 start_codon:yes stop_codon:yes gene_type:complete